MRRRPLPKHTNSRTLSVPASSAESGACRLKRLTNTSLTWHRWKALDYSCDVLWSDLIYRLIKHRTVPLHKRFW